MKRRLLQAFGWLLDLGYRHGWQAAALFLLGNVLWLWWSGPEVRYVPQPIQVDTVQTYEVIGQDTYDGWHQYRPCALREALAHDDRLVILMDCIVATVEGSSP